MMDRFDYQAPAGPHWIGMAIMLVVIGLAVFALLRFALPARTVQNSAGGCEGDCACSRGGASEPLTVLQLRLANGDISVSEYHERAAALKG